MYHSDTPNHILYRYPIDSDSGEISGSREVFLNFENNITDKNYGGRPDGGTFDSRRLLLECSICRRTDASNFPGWNITDEIKLPVKWPTMVCLCGDGLRTLYVTSSRENRSKEELEQFSRIRKFVFNKIRCERQ